MANPSRSEARARMQAAIARVNAAVAEALAAFAALDHTTDLQGAFEAIDELVTALEVALDAATPLRKERIRAIWASEEMSLAVLSERTSISRARAQQLRDEFLGKKKPKKKTDKPEEGS